MNQVEDTMVSKVGIDNIEAKKESTQDLCYNIEKDPEMYLDLGLMIVAAMVS